MSDHWSNYYSEESAPLSGAAYCQMKINRITHHSIFWRMWVLILKTPNLLVLEYGSYCLGNSLPLTSNMMHHKVLSINWPSSFSLIPTITLLSGFLLPLFLLPIIPGNSSRYFKSKAQKLFFQEKFSRYPRLGEYSCTAPLSF